MGLGLYFHYTRVYIHICMYMCIYICMYHLLHKLEELDTMELHAACTSKLECATSAKSVQQAEGYYLNYMALQDMITPCVAEHDYMLQSSTMCNTHHSNTYSRKRSLRSQLCATNQACSVVTAMLGPRALYPSVPVAVQDCCASCRPLELALERRTNEWEAAKAELEASVTINAARQVQVGEHCLGSAPSPCAPRSGLRLVRRLPTQYQFVIHCSLAYDAQTPPRLWPLPLCSRTWAVSRSWALPIQYLFVIHCSLAYLWMAASSSNSGTLQHLLMTYGRCW